ncbi:heat shock protein 70 [Histomonas meleagridis]|uniref:heat shock protein 70 n=1 Tax=Histomonas meleagridis TaxID=135588 RepID=UPI0035599463|nr:heat shock protein 70 [Histomonas meleagridis]KAH0798162.1 heat shock protein 70 [Histomonas meleagridis]
MQPKKCTAIGIDLGTTYTSAAYKNNGNGVENIKFNDKYAIPSIVSYTDDEVLVGDPAKDGAPMNPEYTFFDIKRLIGLQYSNISNIEALHTWPFKVKPGPYGRPIIKWGNIYLYPEQISAQILKKSKEASEEYLGYEVVDAVITVPASFNDGQRQATKDAGKLAGLNVIRIINEPTAAAIAYCYNNKSPGKKHVLVYDLGGGTFDVSILEAEDNCYTVLATDGNMHLGGQDFDNNMVEHFIKIFNEKNNCDISKDLRARSILKGECEKGKINLSQMNKTDLYCPNLYHGIDFKESITREEFENMNKVLFQTTLATIKNLINEINMEPEDIDDIVLVGGSSKIPYVREMLWEYFGKDPLRGIDPETAVAQGAALIAANLTNPDEKEKLIIRDVIPHSLGIKAKKQNGDYFMDIILKRGTTIPTSQKKEYEFKKSKNIIINIYQGEDPVLANNFELGKFRLENETYDANNTNNDISVTFNVDENGILTVKAESEATKQSNGITITSNKGRLNDEEIDKLKEEDEQLMEFLSVKKILMEYIQNEVSNLKKCDQNKRYIKDAFQKLDEVENWIQKQKLLNTSDVNDEITEIKNKIIEIKEQMNELLNKDDPIDAFNQYESQIIELIENDYDKNKKNIKNIISVLDQTKKWINESYPDTNIKTETIESKINENKEKIQNLFDDQKKIDNSINEIKNYITEKRELIETNYNKNKNNIKKVCELINDLEKWIQENNDPNYEQIDNEFNEIELKLKDLFGNQQQIEETIKKFISYIEEKSNSVNEEDKSKRNIQKALGELQNAKVWLENSDPSLEEINDKFDETQKRVQHLFETNDPIDLAILGINEYIYEVTNRIEDQYDDTKKNVKNVIKIIDETKKWIQENEISDLELINNKFEETKQNIEELLEEQNHIERIKQELNDYNQETNEIIKNKYDTTKKHIQNAINIIKESNEWLQKNIDPDLDQIKNKLEETKRNVQNSILKQEQLEYAIKDMKEYITLTRELLLSDSYDQTNPKIKKALQEIYYTENWFKDNVDTCNDAQVINQKREDSDEKVANILRNKDRYDHALSSIDNSIEEIPSYMNLKKKYADEMINELNDARKWLENNPNINDNEINERIDKTNKRLSEIRMDSIRRAKEKKVTEMAMVFFAVIMLLAEFILIYIMRDE